MRAWELWLSRLRARMKELLLAGGIVHADETEVQVLREPGREAKRKSRMWLFAAPACARPMPRLGERPLRHVSRVPASLSQIRHPIRLQHQAPRTISSSVMLAKQHVVIEKSMILIQGMGSCGCFGCL